MDGGCSVFAVESEEQDLYSHEAIRQSGLLISVCVTKPYEAIRPSGHPWQYQTCPRPSHRRWLKSGQTRPKPTTSSSETRAPTAPDDPAKLFASLSTDRCL